MTSAVCEKCAMCGGVLGSFRVMVGSEAFHPRCSHDARDHRIGQLEAALREIATHPTGGIGCNPQSFVEIARKALST